MCVFVYVCTQDDVDDVDDGKDEPSVREHYLVRCALCEQIRTSARRSREKNIRWTSCTKTVTELLCRKPCRVRRGGRGGEGK